VPLTQGTRLGPYEIQSAIGAGGMGEVYRARDIRLERTVAVKVLPSHLSANIELKLRFDREAKAISVLQHPHICTLYDVGSQGGVDFLVREYLEGQTLAERLEKGPLPLEQTLKLVLRSRKKDRSSARFSIWRPRCCKGWRPIRGATSSASDVCCMRWPQGGARSKESRNSAC
jgi:hypothetical protein